MNVKSKLNKLPPDFKKFLREASKLADSLGVSIYLVGGVVRDLIIGRKTIDLDIVIEGDAISFSQKLASTLNVRHKKYQSFGTASIYLKRQKIDFATARTEKYLNGGELPKVKPADLKQDLIRRDFTINTLAVSLNKSDYGIVIDVCKGLSDLKNKVLRIIHGKSFFDDPTRILRCVRFEKRFNFSIEYNTMKCLQEAIACSALESVSPQRLIKELLLILEEENPCVYIKRLFYLRVFPFISKDIDLDRKAFNFFQSLENSVQHYQRKFPDRKVDKLSTLYLAGILSNVSLEKTIDIFNKWSLLKNEKKIIISLKKNIIEISQLNKYSSFWDVYKLLNKYKPETLIFFYAWSSSKAFRRNIDYFWDRLGGVRLKINGNDLQRIGIKPKTLYSQIFDKLICAKIDKGLVSKKQEIGEALSIFKQISSNNQI